MANEKKIHQWLEQEIQARRLGRWITGQRLIDDIMASRSDPNKIPGFNIDYMMREKCALAANYLLPLLDGLELISADRNVSSDLGDTFRPDIIAYNCEQHTFVVFEVKDDKQTEREALTELLAYEHEIQNYIPLSGNFDIAYVLVSSAWSPLLQHSVAGVVTWANKQILCLEVAQDPWQLQVQIPNVWTALASVDLPEFALATLTIGVATPPAGDDVPSIPSAISEGLELLTGEAERSGTHGFAVICHDGRLNVEYPWLIVVALINPQAFFDHAERRNRFERDTPLRSFLSMLAQQAAPAQMRPRLRRLSGSAVEYISSHYPVRELQVEEWLLTRQQLREGTMPVTVEIWGALGEFARFYHTHAGVRASALQVRTGDVLDWHHPLVALPLIDDLTRNRPLLQGALTCSESFRLGVLFGTYNLVVANRGCVNDSFEKNLASFQRWLDAEILIALREINYIHVASRRPRAAPPTVNTQESPPMHAFTDWLEREFIGPSNHVQQVLFTNGRYYAALFDPTLCGWLPEANTRAMTEELATTVLDIVMACEQKLRRHEVASRDDILEGAAEHTRILFGSSNPPSCWGKGHADRLIRSLDQVQLLDLFRSRVLPLCDKVFDDAFFELAPPHAAAVDWDWFRAGIQGMRSRGIAHCGVILYPDGTLATGELPARYCQIFGALDHDLEVFFCAWEGGLTSVYKMTWENLKQGRYLEFL